MRCCHTFGTSVPGEYSRRCGARQGVAMAGVGRTATRPGPSARRLTKYAPYSGEAAPSDPVGQPTSYGAEDHRRSLTRATRVDQGSRLLRREPDTRVAAITEGLVPR